MEQINVKVPAIEKSQYPIFISKGLLADIMATVEKEFPKLTKFIVTDSDVVKAGHLDTLDPTGKVEKYVINPSGEASKTIETVVNIIEKMELSFMGRDSVILALGGGTVGDMAGFAAAIYKRGVKIIQIPTTTVSQADSAVGGKTGVDSTVSKNAFGAFYHPTMVFVDVDTLATLDERQYLAGLVESVKHALIADKEYFEFIEKHINQILQRKPDTLIELAKKNCGIKAGVVEQDPTEKNLRRILNYGHTIGHAVESASNFSLLHGEAVGLGIIAAGIIEKQLKLADDAQLERINAVLEKLNVPTKIPAEISVDAVIDLLRRDKKSVNKWPKFVLLEQIGKAYSVDGQWAVDVEESLVKDVIKMLTQR